MGKVSDNELKEGINKHFCVFVEEHAESQPPTKSRV
jgi:hypothetical protein